MLRRCCCSWPVGHWGFTLLYGHFAVRLSALDLIYRKRFTHFSISGSGGIYTCSYKLLRTSFFWENVASPPTSQSLSLSQQQSHLTVRHQQQQQQQQLLRLFAIAIAAGCWSCWLSWLKSHQQWQQQQHNTTMTADRTSEYPLKPDILEGLWNAFLHRFHAGSMDGGTRLCLSAFNCHCGACGCLKTCCCCSGGCCF